MIYKPEDAKHYAICGAGSNLKVPGYAQYYDDVTCPTCKMWLALRGYPKEYSGPYDPQTGKVVRHD